ncbi:serine hydrolase domain-containing protein [Hyphococcus sp.]|uniref:serine hydrolase domain-containing protein n=1 Tax=Hyphococcus sp. TaxID=2038636 RepID=UPI003CCB95C4
MAITNDDMHFGRRLGLALAVCWLVFVSAAGASSVHQCEASAALDAAAEGMLQQHELTGFALLAGDETGPKLRKTYGDWNIDDSIPVASAGKWLAAATILSLVDDGVLNLDDPISTWFPETPYARKITLRQLLSHTSGIDPFIVFKLLGDDGVEASGRRILGEALLAEPGAEFRYGGSSFQVAGAAAEIATGETWDDLFIRNIVEPLGIESAQWGHPFNGVAVETPQLGGGLFITLDDFGIFLTSLINNGQPILTKPSLDQMLSNMRGGAVSVDVPSVILEPFGYGLGVWCEEDETTECAFAHSTGAFGTMPWIDTKQGVWGIIMMHDRFDRVFTEERALADLMTACVNNIRADP